MLTGSLGPETITGSISISPIFFNDLIVKLRIKIARITFNSFVAIFLPIQLKNKKFKVILKIKT